MINLPVSLPTDLLEKVDAIVEGNPNRFRPANRKVGKGSRAEFVRQAVLFFVKQLDVLKTVHNSPVADLSEGALTAYPPLSTRVNIIRESPLMDLIEESDLTEAFPAELEDAHEH